MSDALREALAEIDALSPLGNMATAQQRDDDMGRRLAASLAFVAAATPAAVRALLNENDRLCAQLEVAQAASEAAVSKAQWQAVTNCELNEAQDEITRLRAAIAQPSPQPAPTALNGIAASMFHDEGAYSQCGNCLRYSLDPKTISGRNAPTCECGESTCWSGSFKKPGPDAEWSGAAGVG